MALCIWQPFWEGFGLDIQHLINPDGAVSLAAILKY
jgi:hypothetical protein